MTDPQEIFETVQAYIKANYLYDYIKAETVKSGHAAGYRRLL